MIIIIRGRTKLKITIMIIIYNLERKKDLKKAKSLITKSQLYVVE